jgi:hypothetical protein
MHFDFSPGTSNDDKIIRSLDHFKNRLCIATKKMDGENTTMTSLACHARSLDSANHPSRNWVKQFHGQIKHLIPADYRICGENLYAQHSIAYHNLESYFYGFSVWDERNVAWSWADTLIMFDELGITPVEVVGEPFIFSVEEVKARVSLLNTSVDEGLVVRVVDEIPYEDYDKLVAKWVRSGHVQTDQHWAHAQIIPNKLSA